jgi:hypothetical protein
VEAPAAALAVKAVAPAAKAAALVPKKRRTI